MIEENGRFYEKCRDCGGAIKELLRSSRQDVCDTCWGRRGWLIKNIAQFGHDPRFKKIQRAMANGRGTAKRQIIALQKELESEGFNIGFYIDQGT